MVHVHECIQEEHSTVARTVQRAHYTCVQYVHNIVLIVFA